MITAKEAKSKCNTFNKQYISDSEKYTVSKMLEHIDSFIREVSEYGVHEHTFEFVFCSICNRTNIIISNLLSTLDEHGFVAELYKLDEGMFDSVGHKQHEIGIIVRW